MTAGKRGDPHALAPGADLGRLVTDAARALASERDPVSATSRLLEILVDALADWGAVHLIQADGTLRRAAVHHRDPARAALVEELRHAPPVDPRAGSLLTQPLHTGRAVLHARLAGEAGFLASPEVDGIWLRLGVRSGAVVPLTIGGRTVGVVALQSVNPHHFPPEVLPQLEALAAEIALLAETSRLARQVEQEEGARQRVLAVLDSLLAHAPVATAVVDTDLCVLHRNEAFGELSVEEPAPFGGTAPAERVHLRDLIPRLARAVEPLLRPALTRREAVDRAELCTGTAAEARYWQVSVFPIERPDGDIFGAGLLINEITEERRAAARQQETVARLDLSLAAGGLGSWEWNLVTGAVVMSPALEALLGYEPGSFGGTPEAFVAAVAEDDRVAVVNGLVNAVEQGDDHHDVFRIVRRDGELRWVELRARILRSPSGELRRLVGVASDVTDRHLIEDIKARLLEREHAARVGAETSRERLALVAEVSAALVSTLDPDAVYTRVADLLVPRLADICVMDALDEDGSLREVALVHIDRDRVPAVRDMRGRRRDQGGDGIWSVRRCVRSGRSERIDDIVDEDLVRAAADEGHLELLRMIDPHEAIVAPLVARGRVLGGVTLVACGERSFGPDDQALVEDLAGRAALAVDNGLLYESRSQVARALQQTLLPPALPEIPGVDLGARYRVAEAGIEIGGDFYDVFESDGQWLVVIGDVCGKGPAAAAVTGLFRHTLRAVVPGESSPAAVLAATNDAILDQIDDTRFATATMVALRPGRGRADLTVACGGHPRPVLVRRDGPVERVDVTGTLLGVLPDPVLRDTDLSLGPGDALVLYTDGVTEARDGPVQFGENRLVEALEGAGADSSAVAVVDRVFAAVDAFRDGDSPADDIAVLVVRVPSVDDL